MRRKRFGRSDGQTLVEFALVLPIFLLVVMGVFEFGRAITYWHDLNNTAQVAARYAVVNRYPGCPRVPVRRIPRLGEERSQLGWAQERPSTSVTVCYRDDDGNNVATAGDPVTVTMTSDVQAGPVSQAGEHHPARKGDAPPRAEQPDQYRRLRKSECAMLSNRPTLRCARRGRPDPHPHGGRDHRDAVHGHGGRRRRQLVHPPPPPADAGRCRRARRRDTTSRAASSTSRARTRMSPTRSLLYAGDLNRQPTGAAVPALNHTGLPDTGGGTGVHVRAQQ